MFLGLRTAIYHVDDIEKGKNWYSEVLGVKPYFDEPFYVGFNVAGYELGLQPDGGTLRTKADGAVAYWGVADCAAACQRILDLGATIHEAVQDVGEGIKVATVKDPFGNIFRHDRESAFQGSIMVTQLHHVNVTVPAELEAATKGILRPRAGAGTSAKAGRRSPEGRLVPDRR